MKTKKLVVGTIIGGLLFITGICLIDKTPPAVSIGLVMYGGCTMVVLGTMIGWHQNPKKKFEWDE